MYGWCGSMAAALQTSQHAHNERARYIIQCVMVPQMISSHPRYYTGSLGVGYTLFCILPPLS
ncbi:MAG TPA: hypothetical protein DEF43_10435 [Chloroflexus aurantiacus]|nr:MAG: hypothetical protein D6716_16320 [Chloroflexota bacterium]HBW67558.1 hypothetical protein [Chloroflexus aurantiacus]